MTRRLLPALLLVSLVVLSVTGRGRSAEPPLVSDEATQRAALGGHARVIVRFNVPFVPEGSLPSAAHVVSQRQVLGAVGSAITGRLRGTSHRVVRQFDGLPLLALEASPDTLRVLESMRGLVAEVVPDRVMRPTLFTSVPLIDADDAWTFGYDGTGTVVAILDTGVDKNHSFFAGGKVIAEACFSSNVPEDFATSACPLGVTSSTAAGSALPCTSADCFHGTHVAGIAAGGVTGAPGAPGPPRVPGAGVAPGAKILAIQVFSDTPDGPVSYSSDQVAAMNYIYNNRNNAAVFGGGRVAALNMSLGGDDFFGPCDDEIQKPAIDLLRSVGIATVIAAGNDGLGNGISTPGCISSAISVGSTTKGDIVSSFSNVAPFLSLFAPGSFITSSLPGNVFGVLSGTSMATPHVTGTFAILRQATPNVPENQVVDTLLNALQTTGKPIGDTRPGVGLGTTRPRIQVLAALHQVASPDLVVQTLTGPATALPGATINLSVSAKNTGLGPAGMTVLRFYLSGDSAITTSDTQLAEINVPMLTSGQTSPPQTVPVTIPPGTTPGAYFIGAYVDPLATIAESNDSNNTKTLAVRVIQPDLQMTALSSATLAQTSRPLAVSSTVWNRGTTSAGPFRVSFYMAQGDSTPGAGVQVGFRDLTGGLAANANSSATTTLTIPANFSAGTYFLSARADSLGVITESDETNNGLTAANPVVVTLYRPDLLLTALSAPSLGQTSRPLAVANIVRNQGAASAGAFRVNFFMSPSDATPGAGTLVGFRPVASLAGFTNSSATTTLTIPANFSAGTYFLSAVVDPGTNVELPGDNNGLTAGGQVNVTLYRPDFVVTSLSAPSLGQTSRPLAVANIVRNQGAAPAGPFRVNFFMSPSDATPGAGALVGFRPVASLAGFTNSSASTTLTIPANFSAGTYYLSAVVDPLANVELPGANNGLTASGQINVTLYRPDFIVTALSAPSSGQTNRPLAIANTVRNQGAAPAGPFRVNVFMSPSDATPGAGALVGFRAVASLAGFTNSSATTTVTLPGNLSEGTYFLSAVVDPLANVELPGSNNGLTSGGKVAVTLYRPELTMTALSGPLFGKIGRTISVTSAVRNAGPAPATAFKVRFYVSNSSATPGAGTMIGSRDVTALAVGANVSASTTLTIPAGAGLAEGNYYLSAVADADNQQAELNESNNGITAPSQIALTLLRPDLTVTAATVAPVLASPGFTVNVASTVGNVGDVATAAPVLVRFYLSPTATLNGSQVLLGSRSIATPLAAPPATPSVSTATTPLTIPRNTAVGTWFIVAVVNEDNAVIEYPGANNTRATGALNVQLPNLQVVSIAPPVAAIRGKGIDGAPTASVVVRNIGQGPALPFSVQVFTNRDDGTPGAQQPGLGDMMFNRSVTTLAPSGSVTLSGPVAVDETVGVNVRLAGNYFVSAIADPSAQNVDADPTNNRLTETGNKVAILPDMKKLKQTSVSLALSPSTALSPLDAFGCGGISSLLLKGPFNITTQNVANPSTFSGTVTLDDFLVGFHQVYNVTGSVQAFDQGTLHAGVIASSFTYTSTILNEFSASGRGSINGAAPALDFSGGTITGHDNIGGCTFTGSINVTR